jgi:hypothetical protein
LVTYLYECSLPISLDWLVIHFRNCKDYTFGNVGFQIPFVGINDLIGTQGMMNIFYIFIYTLIPNLEPPIRF